MILWAITATSRPRLHPRRRIHQKATIAIIVILLHPVAVPVLLRRAVAIRGSSNIRRGESRRFSCCQLWINAER